jgi:hypothetical protein
MSTFKAVVCCVFGLGVGLNFAAAEPRAETQPKQPPSEPTLTIVNVASHCDWSWAHTRAWHEDRYALMIHDYLILMRKNPKLVWQLETVNEQLLPFLVKARQQWPEMIDEFWQRVREGRIEVVSAYSNPRLSEVYPELFVRSLVLGKEYFRGHVPGIRQDVLEVPDLMCGTSQVPQMLALADYRYFMFTRRVSQQCVFWRRGLDGTRVLSCKDVYGYPEMQGKPGAAFPGINPVPVWRYAIGCDDMPPTQATVDEALAGNSNKRILSTMLRFFQECEKHSDKLTELSGSLDSCNYYTMAGMHGSENLHTLHNQNEDLLLSLEKAQTMAAMLDRPFYSEPVDGLWQEALSTSGHAIEWCWKEDYDERMAQGRHTREKARRFLEDSLAAIASAIPLAPDRGTPLVVFNFHSWPVSGPVQFAVEGGAERLELCDSDGKRVPLQIVTDGFDGVLRAAFNATAVPACGLKTYYVRRLKDNSQDAPASTMPIGGPMTIESDLYRITARPDGRLELFDKVRGVSLGAPDVGGMGDLVIYDMPPTDIWLHVGPPGKRRDWKPDADQWRSLQGPVYASLVMPGKIGKHSITRVVRLWRGSPRIEFGVELNTAQPDNAVFCIRFPIGMSGNVVAGIPFGVESRDNLANEIFRGENFCTGFPEGYDATRWTDVSSPNAGYTFICPPGMFTGYGFKRSEQTIEFILNSFQPMPKDFARVAPSLQGTGRHRWWCALLPHAGTWSDAKSYRQALEQHAPLVAWSTAYGLDRGGVASLPEGNKSDRPNPASLSPSAVRPQPAMSLVELTPANVVLSSMRLLPTAMPGRQPPIELRLYESTGQASDVTIRLARPATSAELTNFLGKPLPQAAQVQLAGNEIRFRIEPWKIVTLRINSDR